MKLHDESTLRERIRTNLVEWATEVLAPAGLTPSVHQRLLLSYLDLVTKGEIKRLLILMPPGSAKSTYTSVIFPVWWFIQHPRSSVIAASSTVALVESFSRRILDIIDENKEKTGFTLNPSDRSASHWRTSRGGEYFTVGIRGTITGRRADLIIVDDPIKSMAEADSPKHRRDIWNWYTAELITRLKPEGRIVIVMTRWHENDLGGQVLADKTEKWEVLRLPAVAEQEDPLGRPPGAPLWPEWESIEALEQKKKVVGSRVWSSLFQQSPLPPGDRLFKVSAIPVLDHWTEPEGRRRLTVRAWDLASTSAETGNDPDWTVGLKLTRLDKQTFVIEDIVRVRKGYQQVIDAIVDAAQSDGHAVVVSLPIDPGQAGKAQIGTLSSLLAGFQIYSSRESGAKSSRAIAVASQVEAGNLSIVRAGWNQSFLDELELFPWGPKDDQVDALSRAFNTIIQLPAGSRRTFIPYNVR